MLYGPYAFFALTLLCAAFDVTGIVSAVTAHAQVLTAVFATGFVAMVLMRLFQTKL